jgi:hypothetical protein
MIVPPLMSMESVMRVPSNVPENDVYFARRLCVGALAL